MSTLTFLGGTGTVTGSKFRAAAVRRGRRRTRHQVVPADRLRSGTPAATYVVHGEPESAASPATEHGWTAVALGDGERVLV